MVLLHHESDVDTWGGKDRDYYTFVVTSVLLGLMGGDHVYLRSFKTAFLKALVNLFTFGSWYWWDLSQVLFQKETVLKEGLASPFDWIRNIGRGVFVNPAEPVSYFSQKSFILYGICAVFFGLIGADKFYMGEYALGVFKLILCLNIFTFLLGWLWAGWDAWNVVFCEKELLEKGIPPPLGFGFVLPHTDASVFKLVEKKEGAEGAFQSFGLPVSIPSGPVGPWIHWIVGMLGLLPKPDLKCEPRTFVPPRQAEAPTNGAPTNGGPTNGAPKNVAPVNEAPKNVASVNEEPTNVAPKNVEPKNVAPVNEAPKNAEPTNQAPTNQAPTNGAPTNGAPTNGESKNQDPVNEPLTVPSAAERRQTGGARSDDSSGPGPVIAGCLAAVLAAAGLKRTYEFIQQQYQ